MLVTDCCKARQGQGSPAFRGAACRTQTGHALAVCVGVFGLCGERGTPHRGRALANGSDQQPVGCSAARWVSVAPALGNFHTHYINLQQLLPVCARGTVTGKGN